MGPVYESAQGLSSVEQQPRFEMGSFARKIRVMKDKEMVGKDTKKRLFSNTTLNLYSNQDGRQGHSWR